MPSVPINCEVPLEEVIEGLLSNSSISILEVIMQIDADLADEGFTYDLIDRLVKSLLNEEEQTSEDYLALSLKSTFITDRERESNGGKTYESLHCEAENRSNQLKSILKILDNLQSIPGS